MTQWRSRSPRYEILRDEGINVFLQPTQDGEEAAPIPARLKQISFGGARLLTRQTLRLESNLCMKIAFRELEFETFVDARVAWARPLFDGEWILGCAFSPELPEQLLDALADMQYIDRRGSGRTPTQAAANVRHESKQDLLPATIVDYSYGGVCLEVAEIEQLGRKIQLVVETPNGSQTSMLRVCWLIENVPAALHLIGCEYIDQQASGRMRKCLDEECFVHQDA
ncbi:MAG: PilZ domain-containing protein [Pirellulales bacterium]|nr:PilZ domain-containing protein [Pirellulales bacterium]